MTMRFTAFALRLSSTVLAIGVAALTRVSQAPASVSAPPSQPHLGTRGVPIIERDGLRFKDLNRSGAVDPYEDWRLTPAARARDLVGRMTVEEKAGTMMHGTARGAGPMAMAGIGASYDTAANRALI